jgi:hypothetical protein
MIVGPFNQIIIAKPLTLPGYDTYLRFGLINWAPTVRAEPIIAQVEGEDPKELLDQFYNQKEKYYAGLDFDLLYLDLIQDQSGQLQPDNNDTSFKLSAKRIKGLLGIASMLEEVPWTILKFSAEALQIVHKDWRQTIGELMLLVKTTHHESTDAMCRFSSHYTAILYTDLLHNHITLDLLVEDTKFLLDNIAVLVSHKTPTYVSIY